jgi:hypothetical protein
MSSLFARAAGNTNLIIKDRLKGHPAGDRNFVLFTKYLCASRHSSLLACQLPSLPAFQPASFPAFSLF